MNTMNRRRFLTTTGKAAVAAGAAQAFSINALGANEKVRVAMMGIRERGMQLTELYAKHPNVEIAYMADPDSTLYRRRAKDLERAGVNAPPFEQDFRRVLDDKDVDAMVIATPDHWHALGTILACQAGKHVYVEKPSCHSIWEGQKMVEAAAKYDRLVQVGVQNRSMPCVLKAREYIRGADFGEVHFVRIVNDKSRPPVGRSKDGPVPEGVDYDMWLGPADDRPFNPAHFHYNWHWFWQYSGGDIMNDGVHQLDIVRFLLAQDYPKSVYSTGGKFYFKDYQETPDTHVANYDFTGVTVVMEQTLWVRYMKKDPHEFPTLVDTPWSFNGTRIEVYGSRQQLLLARHGGGWEAFDAHGKSVHKEPSHRQDELHIDNFVQSIRGEAELNAPIIEGHRSTLLCHYGNISYRLGRKITIDPKTELFVDDEEACNEFLAKRTYREKWQVPEQV